MKPTQLKKINRKKAYTKKRNILRNNVPASKYMLVATKQSKKIKPAKKVVKVVKKVKNATQHGKKNSN